MKKDTARDKTAYALMQMLKYDITKLEEVVSQSNLFLNLSIPK
jgi:hypothetical protein